MNRNVFLFGILSISSALLAGAFAFEHFGGLKPCNLCTYQRYAHFAVILLTIEALTSKGSRGRYISHIVGFLASLLAAGVAFFHAGVEIGIWEGLASCSERSEDLAKMTGDDLLSFQGIEPLVLCSDVAWSFLGISMAGWNSFITLGASSLWIFSLRMMRQERRSADV